MASSMKASHVESKSFQHQESSGRFSSDEKVTGQALNQWPKSQNADKTRIYSSYSNKSFIGNGNGIINNNIRTEEYGYSSSRLFLSLSDYSNLNQIIRKNVHANTQLVIIETNDSGEINMDSLLSNFNFRNYLQIVVEESEDDNGKFMDALIRTLIDINSKLLIQFRLDTSENEYNGLYFTTNAGSAQNMIEFLKSECNLSDKQASLMVWRTSTKNLLSRDSRTKEFSNHDVYFSYNEKEHQSKSFSKVFEYLNTESEETTNSALYSEDSSLNSGRYSNNTSSTTTTTTTTTTSSTSSSKSVWSEKEESIGAKLFRKECFKDDETYETVYIHKITVQVTSNQRENIIQSLKLNVLSSDALNICSIQESDGSFSDIHHIILEHLRIDSIEEAIGRFYFFVGLENARSEDLESDKYSILKILRNCDESIWKTAFVIKYLENIIDEQQSEWQEYRERGNEWIYEQLRGTQYMEHCRELLFSASEEYLIERGIEVHNALRNKIIYDFEVDHNITENIKEKLDNSTTHDSDINELMEAQRNEGHFECHELKYGSFTIPFDKMHIDTLKKYTGKLCLRRLDKDVWVTSLVTIFLENFLDNHRKSEWESANDNAKAWISDKLSDSEKEELHEACKKYLLKKSFDYLY